MTPMICSLADQCDHPRCYHAASHERVEECGARTCYQQHVKCVPTEAARTIRVRLDDLPRVMGENPTFAVVGLERNC